MNERIKELAEQAEILITEVGAFHNTPYGSYQLQEQQMKKFAELIVKECQVALSPMLRDMISRGQAYNLIKEHFGVQE